DPGSIEAFRELLAARTGLSVRTQEREQFKEALTSRARALRLPGLADYRRLLQGETEDAEAEWQRLLPLLTNRETHFFRDPGQMQLLRERILPELLERNRRQRQLRLWSAGCSTGEEPYSLAILLDEILPDSDGWNLLLLATDLNEEALETARRGVYGRWS